MKKLIKNVVLLDMTAATEESVKGLEIRNAVTVLVTPVTRPLLDQITIGNIVNVVEIPDDVTFLTHNGDMIIDGDFETSHHKKIFWIINGVLLIREGVTSQTLESLFSYGGEINGKVYLPKTLAPALSTATVNINGAIYPYPTGSILYKEDIHINNSFLQGLPENSETVFFEEISISPDTSPEIFQKHIKRLTVFGDTILPYELRDAFYKVAQQYNKIIEIPKGYTFLNEPISISQASLLTFKGKSIYTCKDIHFKSGIDGELLRQLDFRLSTEGSLILPENIAMIVFDKVQANHIYTYRGNLVTVQDELSFAKSGEPVSYLIKSTGILSIPDTTTLSDIRESINEIFLYGSITLQKEQIPAISDKIAIYDGQLFSLQMDDDKEKQDDDTRQYDTVIGNAVNYKL